MLDKEKELVNEEFVRRRDTYNCVLGGGGQFTAKRGNHGSNNRLAKLNAMEKIEICNPYTHQKKRLYAIKEIPQEYVDAGWERGTLSKFNTTLISYKDMTLSVRKFSEMHHLKEWLTYERVQRGWTTDELLSIPEDLRLYKSKEEKEAKLKDGIEKGKLKLKKSLPARRAKRLEKLKSIA